MGAQRKNSFGGRKCPIRNMKGLRKAPVSWDGRCKRGTSCLREQEVIEQLVIGATAKGRRYIVLPTAPPLVSAGLSPSPICLPTSVHKAYTCSIMYPIADLTAFCKRTTGDVPPKLVVCTNLSCPNTRHSPSHVS